jgi:glycosyltransferase involved in cell wall biosynthesis
MNILIIMPFRLSDVGGVSAAVQTLSRNFAQSHRVTILLPGGSSRIQALPKFGAIPVFSLYMRSPCPKRVSALWGFISFLVNFPRTVTELRRFLKEQETDIVLIQYPLAWVVYFAILRSVASWKLVLTYQGNDAHDVALWKWAERQCVKVLLSKADCIVAVSRSLLSKLSKVAPGLRKKARVVIPNGAPFDVILQPYLPRPEVELPKEYIVTVGQLIRRKGLDVLLQALKITCDNGQELNLVLVGDGPERKNLEDLSAKLGLSRCVYFVGNQPQEVVLGIIKNALFFVLASRAEGLPLVIAEAMACGKAVVSTSVDGVPEIVVENVSGLLVEADNPRALAAALVKLVQNPELREAFGRQGRVRAEKSFTWRIIADRYLDLFRRIKGRGSLDNSIGI